MVGLPLGGSLSSYSLGSEIYKGDCDFGKMSKVSRKY